MITTRRKIDIWSLPSFVPCRDIKLDSEPFNKRWLRVVRSNKTFAGVLACNETTEPRRINGRVIMKRDAEIARFVKRRGMPDACWRSSAALAFTVCKLMVTRFNSAINRGHPCSGHRAIAYPVPFLSCNMGKLQIYLTHFDNIYRSGSPWPCTCDVGAT